MSRFAHVALSLVLVLVLAGAAVFVLSDQTDDPSQQAGPTEPRLQAPPESGPGLRLAPAPEPAAVLEAVDPAPVSARQVRRRLRDDLADRALGRHVGFAVASLHGEEPLWSFGRPDTVTPASTMKLLTTLTALETLGPEHRFTTSVVSGRSRRQLVLLGGGDPLLTDDRLTQAERQSVYPRPATLEDLAARTATTLKRHGVQTVTLSYDDSLFRGPGVNPAWPASYISESIVSPISALWVDEGRAVAGLAQRVRDPSDEAARRFAAKLSAAGVNVRADVTRGRATRGASLVASVESPPLGEIVQHVLELSDNEGAEVLLRQSAIATGRPASFRGGAATVSRVVGGFDIDLRGALILDGSGLSREDVVPVGALVDVLQTAADQAHPALRAVVSTLPVAGFTGSLAYRFLDDAPAGLGLVRAKTGTLTGVHALAGIAMTGDGQALVFAAVADRVPVPRTLDARSRLDVIAATLAGCGCLR